MKNQWFVAILGCLLINFFFFSCIKPQVNRLIHKRVEYSKDSAEMVNLTVWAVECYDLKKTIDTLKPKLFVMEQLWKEYGDTTIWKVYSHSLFEVGFRHQILGEYDSSYIYLQKCYELCMAVKGENYLLTTMCLNKLSFYYEHIGDLKKQKEFLFRSFDIRRRILDSNDLFLAYSYSNLSSFYWQIGDFSKQKIYDEKFDIIIRNQFKLFEETKDPYQNKKLIGLHGYLADLPNLISIYLSSIPIQYGYVLLDNAFNAATRNEFGLSEQNITQLEDVMIRYPELLPRFRTGILRIRAETAMQKENFLMANLLFDSLVDYHKSVKSKEDLIWDYHQKSYALSKLGKYQEAIDIINNYFSPIKNDVKALNYKYWRLSQLSFQGGFYNETLNLCDSVYKFLLVSEQYDSLRQNRLSWAAHQPEEIGNLLKFLYIEIDARIMNMEQSNDAETRSILDRFDLFNSGLVYLQEKNFTEEGKISQEIQFYPLYEKVIHLAASVWSLSMNDKYIESILNWSDAHKSIALRNSIFLKSELSITEHQGVLSDLLEIQKEIERTKILLKETERKNDKRDSSVLNNLNSTLFELIADHEIFYEKNKDQLKRVYNPIERIQFPIEEVTNYLKVNDAQLIDFFVGDEYLIGTLLSAESKFCYSQKLTMNELQLLDSFVQNCNRNKLGDDFSKINSAVYSLLIEPIQGKLKAKHLIIIPDAFLYKLPFEILENVHGEFLVQHHTLQYEFSGRLLLQESNSNANILYSGFAPQYQGTEEINISQNQSKILENLYEECRASLGPLAFNIPEVTEGANLMNGNSYTGYEVSKNIFREKSKDSRILHLAMHALSDDQNPDYSQLLFRADGNNEPLFAYELSDFELNSELAILSACNTGVGVYQRGDGVRSLARAFKSAGCKNIVMSLWPANDASTKEIVVGFLGNIKSGMGKADALRKAKLDYLESATPDTRLPYYWAGLVLFGDNDVMSFSRPWLWITSSLAVLFFLWLAWIVVRRKRSEKLTGI